MEERSLIELQPPLHYPMAPYSKRRPSGQPRRPWHLSCRLRSCPRSSAGGCSGRNRFFAALSRFDEAVGSGELLGSVERLFQGPVADALTHVGQLAMLRRLAGSPVQGENYFKAEIAVGQVGAE